MVYFLDENTVEVVPKVWVDNKQYEFTWDKSYAKPFNYTYLKKVILNKIEFIYFKDKR